MLRKKCVMRSDFFLRLIVKPPVSPVPSTIPLLVSQFEKSSHYKDVDSCARSSDNSLQHISLFEIEAFSSAKQVFPFDLFASLPLVDLLSLFYYRRFLFLLAPQITLRVRKRLPR